MTCKICGKETDWDTSYGRPCFIVCGSCFHKLTKKVANRGGVVLRTILAIGWTMEEEEEKNNE